MKTIAFDAHAYVKKLKAVGFTEDQAEVQAEALADIVDERLVTKDYLDLRLKELESRLESRIKDVELRIMTRLGGMIAVSTAILAALIKL